MSLSDAVRALGHDVLTASADGRASQGIDDQDVHVAVSAFPDLNGVLIRVICPNLPPKGT